MYECPALFWCIQGLVSGSMHRITLPSVHAFSQPPAHVGLTSLSVRTSLRDFSIIVLSNMKNGGFYAASSRDHRV